MQAASERNYVLVSADGHAGAELHQYRDYLEQRWHEDFDRWAASFKDGWEKVDDEADDKIGVASFMNPVNWQGDRRTAAVEREGIAAEVLFPNTVPPFYPSG